MRWFRFYDDVVNDPKVQNLCGDDFKDWVNILCIASKNGGCLPSLTDLSFTLRVTVERVTSLSHSLKKLGLIDEKHGRMVPHNWDKRQYKSDTSAERMKRHRDRKRDVTVTAPEQITDTEQNRTDLSIKKPLGFEDLKIDDIQIWLSEKRVSGRYLTIDEYAMLEMFKDYCRSKRPKYKDYVAALRNSFNWDNAPKKGNNEPSIRNKTRSDIATEAGERGLAIANQQSLERIAEREKQAALLPAPASFRDF